MNAAFGGRLSAVLYLLCGSLVAVAAPVVPLPGSANRLGLMAVAAVTLLSGVVIAKLPWWRWGRATTLWLVPSTFALIALDNVVSGGDGFRYAPFFFVTFAWIGLVHRRWTSIAVLPLATAAYLVPLVGSRWTAVTVASAVFVLPACVLLGEAIAWVTERLAQTQRSLRAGEESFRQLFADNPQPMWLYDIDTGMFLEVNAAAVAHYGYGRDEFLRLRIDQISGDGRQPTFAEPPDGSTVRTVRSAQHVLNGGRMIEVDLTAHHLVFGGHRAVLAAMQDVTERNRLGRELEHRAFHDSLTDLANRALFTDRLEHALARHVRDRSPGFAVVVLDLDGFKTVNDSLGHTLGDELLRAVGVRLHTHLRPGDTAARLGGDEFALLIEPISDIDTATARTEQLLAELRAPYDLEGKNLTITASAGVAFPRPGDCAEELVRNADMAMYLAKHEGKSCVRRFETAMHVAAVARLELESELRRAVSREELCVYYQPTIRLADQTIVGYEALLRWKHPQRGLLAPAQFIGIAEETGLIVDLGRFVLDQSCDQARRWRDLRPELDLSISINLSGRQLRDISLIADVAAALERSGLPPEALILEITETVLVDDPTTIAALGALRTLGVQLAIDDFGTGYSSLSYLQTLPVNILKIDKSFIDHVATTPEAVGLVEAILAMARTLGLATIAEGVEAFEQVSKLKALGTESVQGFYYAQPAPPDAITATLDPAPATSCSDAKKQSF